MADEHETARTDRRQALKAGAGAGVALMAWTAPVISSFGTPAVAGTPKPPDGDGQTYPEPDDKPWITDIADQWCRKNDSTGELPFLIGSDSLPAGDLGVSCRSSDSDLFPSGNLILRGTDAQRTIEAVPQNGWSGSAEIEIIADNGLDWTSQVFQVTVLRW